MITAWDVYWLTRIDSICGALMVILICSGIAVALFILYILMEREVAEYKTPIIKYISVWCTLLLICMFIPSSREIAAIYLLPRMVNNENVQKIPDQALRLLSLKLEQWMGEIADKKK